jgi:pentatricopeptide repeat protein
MTSDDKEYQKAIVDLAKKKDITGLLALMNEMSSPCPPRTVGPQSTKMAINMSVNLLSECGDVSKINLLKDLTGALLIRFPELCDLDNICCAQVKIHISLGESEEAVKVALGCNDARLRTFSVILDSCATKGDFSLANRLIRELENRGLVPTESDFANLIVALSNSKKENWSGILDGILEKLSAIYDVIEEENLLQGLVTLLGQHAISVNENQVIEADRNSEIWGLCPITRLRLRLIDLSNEEIDEMLDLTRRLALEAHKLRTSSEEGFDFDSVVSSLDSLPNIILDAANLAHTNQNFEGGYFRFDQVDEILEKLKREEGTEKKYLVVIHEKWLNPDRDLSLHLGPESGKKKRKTTLPQLGNQLVEGRPVVFEDAREDKSEKPPIVHPVPADIIDKWKANKEILVVPHGQNDDWFWMHICLLSMRKGNSNVTLVSNDQMRDHFWRMKNPKFFLRFRTNHVAQYTIQFGEDKINSYNLTFPIPFSICLQKNGKVWHVPYKTAEGIRWMIFSDEDAK